jgi:DNA-binding NarL/FixJ family response regulator
MVVRVLIADDHRIMRDGLRSLIAEERDMTVIGEAENGRAAVRMVEDLSPDVVIMDVSMPELNGLEATRQIAGTLPGLKVIALSMHSDRRFVAGMLAAGASGYLLKDCAFDELVRAVRAVAAGQTYLSPGVAGAVVQDYVNRLTTADKPAPSVLSPREREVLQLVAEGWATKEIAARLHVSVKTIETHRGQIMDKLGVRSVAELTKQAIQMGLTSLDS